MRMHEDEFEIDVARVRALVAARFPAWAQLPVRRVRSTGTVNAIFRLGDELCLRLPRLAHSAADLDREARWLPEIAPRVSALVPEPLALAGPAAGYPFHWAVYRWIAGDPYDDAGVGDERRAAEDLATFVHELRTLDPRVPDAPRGGRRPLRELDRPTREALEAARGAIDADAALAAWARALEVPVWDGAPVWLHGDLLRPNLLTAGGRLHAVLDFGGVGVGDPATDVIAAWSVFGADGRARYREALAVDDATWERARGIALHQAALIIPYYARSNPEFAALAGRTVRELLTPDG